MSNFCSIISPQLSALVFLKTGFFYVALAVLELADQAGLEVRDPPPSASLSAGIKGIGLKAV